MTVGVRIHRVSVDRLDPAGRPVRILTIDACDIAAGSRVAIMGPGGAGKSTYARVVARLEHDSVGEAQWLPAPGGAPSLIARPVVLVPQRADAAFSCTTVRAELGLALELSGVSGAALDDAVHRSLALVGLDGAILDRDPLALSGGERRRVAIAAAMTAAPGMLVLDEPSAGLDARARDLVHAAVASLHRSGIGTVVVTHDAAEARLLADRLIVVDSGQIVSDGPIGRVLDDAEACRRYDIEPDVDVSVVARIARTRGVAQPVLPDTASREAWIAAQCASPFATSDVAVGNTVASDLPVQAGRTASPVQLPPAPHAGIDPRTRIIAFVLIIAASFAAHSLVGVGVVLAVMVGVAVRARHTMRSVATVLRPVVILLAGILVLQVVVGADPAVHVTPSLTVESGALWGIQRAMQVCALLIAGLIVGVGSGPIDIAAGCSFLLAPLRLLRVPVTDLALVMGIGAAASSAMARELQQLEDAQRARGIEPSALPVRRRLRARTMLIIPLFVIASQRARHMAEALAVRGFARGMPIRLAWRSGGLSMRDVRVLLGAGILLAVSLQL